jgi:addiction module HigA family antidote
MSLHNPPHPGEVIRTEIIQAHGLTVTDAAKVLGVSRQALSGLVNAKVDLTGDMALRIEKAFGPKMETLMRMQSAFDIFQTRQRASQIDVRPFRSLSPLVPAR